MRRVAIFGLACVLALWTSVASAQVLGNGPILTTGDSIIANLGQAQSVTFQITNTFVGTLTFQASGDCSNYTTLQVFDSSSGGSVTTATSTGLWATGNSGFQCVRVYGTAMTSGRADVMMTRGYGGGSAVSGGGSVVAFQGGTWTGQQGTPPWSMVGTKTNNSGVPGTDNLGVFPCVSNATAPTFTETDQTSLSCDNHGSARMTLMSPAGVAVAIGVLDPCENNAKTTTPISITADTVVISATSAKINYVCNITIVAGGTEIVGLTEGTGSTCGTNEVALFGSTTDANGASLAANGGIAMGDGKATVIAGKTTNSDMCLNVSAGSVRIAGSITWVQQ